MTEAQSMPGTTGPASSRALRASATLVLVRDAPDGPEVLLVRRADRGTNSYLLCCEVDASKGQGRWALIDPGPDDSAHVQALLGHLPGRLVAILVTHTHIDHSPAARRLKALTGAPIYGRAVGDPVGRPYGQDPDFAPDKELQGGERLRLGAALSLRAIHTPGHASNHFCYLPIVGAARRRSWPHSKPSVSLDVLLARVYDDLPVERHAVARRSLLAHLIHLRAQHRARQTGDLWSSR